MVETEKRLSFIDGSRLITEAMVQAGADVFVGYPITPANLLYLYSGRRFPSFIAAPDEITTLQLMSGFAVSGKVPVTASSFPGYALMIESINMAYMMELPMVIILVQRLGPATGTATCGAQGDLALLNGSLSGGYSMPVISPSQPGDCWTLAAKAVETAIRLRTPVIFLTSKEEVMTLFSFDESELETIEPVKREYYSKDEPYLPYLADKNLVPPFLPVTNTKHQVRITASTHDTRGILQNTTKEAIDNTIRIQNKIIHNLADFTHFEIDEQSGADTLLVSWGITAQSARIATQILREEGLKISLFVPKTLLPVPDLYYDIIGKYKKVFFAEENLTGQLMQLMYGSKPPAHIFGINKISKMIDPIEIINIIKKQNNG